MFHNFSPPGARAVDDGTICSEDCDEKFHMKHQLSEITDDSLSNADCESFHVLLGSRGMQNAISAIAELNLIKD